jgi:hypothetical protein
MDESRSPSPRKGMESFQTTESTAGLSLAKVAKTATESANAHMLHNGLYS